MHFTFASVRLPFLQSQFTNKLHSFLVISISTLILFLFLFYLKHISLCLVSLFFDKPPNLSVIQIIIIYNNNSKIPLICHLVKCFLILSLLICNQFCLSYCIILSTGPCRAEKVYKKTFSVQSRCPPPKKKRKKKDEMLPPLV